MTQATAGKKKSKAPSNPWSTPAMQQYRSMKEAHPECVLFFRMGDFYEMFDEDARTVSKAIGLTLTQRGNGLDMAGVPFHAAEGYLRRMIEQGFRVAVCEQLEDPAQATGVVKRGVTRVVTPGTLVDAFLLDESTSNVIGAMRSEGDVVSVATIELSTGTFELHQCQAKRLDDLIERLGLCEVVIGEDQEQLQKQLTRFGVAVTLRPAWMYANDESMGVLEKQFGVTTVEGFGLASNELNIGPAGALLTYLKQTQASDSDLPHLRPPAIKEESAFVSLDATTIRSLEIVQTMKGNSTQGSLLWVMQRCHTAMGKRLLRTWLCEPLSCKDAILKRQSVVTQFLADQEMLRKIVNTLDEVQDVARIAGRVSMGRVTPRDIVALGNSIDVCGELANLLGSPATKHVQTSFEDLSSALAALGQTIQSQCIDAPPAHMRDGGLFKDGFDSRTRRSQNTAT